MMYIITRLMLYCHLCFPAWNIDYDMRVVDVVYDSYAIVHINKIKDTAMPAEYEVINKLFSE